MISAYPRPPDFRVDWALLEPQCPWLKGLAGCQQDPVHHREGDVATHTRLVAEAMAANPAWRALDEPAREVLFLAALHHDLGKPACARPEPDGRIKSPGHSWRGERISRSLLYRSGVDSDRREAIASLIRFHQVPFHLMRRDDPRRAAYGASLAVRCEHLALLAESDARGRVADDVDRLLENVGLFRAFCRDHGCLEGPRAFPSDHSRFLYFRKDGRDPDQPVADDTRLEVVMLTGLPGAGHERWLAHHAGDRPVVRLDPFKELGGRSAGGPGAGSPEAARAAVREHLRADRGFVLDAANLSRDDRRRWIGLFASHRARVRIVALEAPYAAVRQRSRMRGARVPERVLERMIGRWEPPDASEAHSVELHRG